MLVRVEEQTAGGEAYATRYPRTGIQQHNDNVNGDR